jgi:hypothetical protein
MRVLIFMLSLLMLCGNGFARKKMYLFSTFREPATAGLYLACSSDGYHWTDLGGPYLKPEVGIQKVMRDPSVAQGPDGTFHMVWTSSWKGDLGFGYASTNDFIHWSEERFIPVMSYDTSTVNVWAPEIFYDDEKDHFIIVWASTIPYKFEKGGEEERNNHRLYYTTTKDFITFRETKLFLDPGFSAIDAVIVKRGKNDYVLVLKDNTRPCRNIKVAFCESPLGPWKNISKPFTKTFTEGPTVAKVGKEYLIYYDAYRDKKYGAARTSDFINFEDVSSLISLPEGHKHGTVFMANRNIVENLKKNGPLGSK